MNRVAGFGKDPEHSLEYMDLSPIYLDLDVASSRLKSLGETPRVIDQHFPPAHLNEDRRHRGQVRVKDTEARIVAICTPYVEVKSARR